jgi:hypothetical protein
MKKRTIHETKIPRRNAFTKGDPDAPYRRTRSQPIGATAVCDEITRLFAESGPDSSVPDSGLFVTFEAVNPMTSDRAKNHGFYGVSFLLYFEVGGKSACASKVVTNQSLTSFDGTPEEFARKIYEELSSIIALPESALLKHKQVTLDAS